MDEQFDYIIVGAGSAGCVLANRLTADGSRRVLLLEAGPVDSSPWVHMPMGYYKTIFDPRLGWGYQAEPDAATGDRPITWTRGRLLGGSSSINGMIYIRGQREDYEGWKAAGNPGWGWDDVLPYFKKSEDWRRGPSPLHGSGGELTVSDPWARDPMCDVCINAAEQVGLPRNDDFNGATQEGVGYYQHTVRNGRRCSAAKAFLAPARGRANLKILTEALVGRVLIENGRAVGVEYRHDGRVQRATARAEVLLSGGVINSPQLLQLSGIGPAEVLRAQGIEIKHASPDVGRNLQDHYNVYFQYACKEPITWNMSSRGLGWKAMAGLKYLLGTGPLTMGAGVSGGFAATDPQSGRPDVQLFFIPYSTDPATGRLHGFSGFTFAFLQIRPESRGYLEIRSADAQAAPAIHARYLTDSRDIETVLRAARLAEKIVAAPALQPYLLRPIDPAQPLNDDDMIAFIRKNGRTGFHPVGTCRMGSDERAVVDPSLRVNGVAGLRVIDASVMPTLVSGNTNAATIMIAEKAAALVLQGEKQAAESSRIATLEV
ncbi:MAG: GMC family oxidoreductase [Janthinobacterium lividum]